MLTLEVAYILVRCGSIHHISTVEMAGRGTSQQQDTRSQCPVCWGRLRPNFHESRKRHNSDTAKFAPKADWKAGGKSDAGVVEAEDGEEAKPSQGRLGPVTHRCLSRRRFPRCQVLRAFNMMIPTPPCSSNDDGAEAGCG
jgi:hypothetical protein